MQANKDHMTVKLQVSSFRHLSDETRNAWSEHPVLSGWAHGMSWKWEGGEALTVLVGRQEEGSAVWYIIKFQGKVRVVQYPGIRKALMGEFGIQSEVKP